MRIVSNTHVGESPKKIKTLEELKVSKPIDDNDSHVREKLLVIQVWIEVTHLENKINNLRN